MKGLVALSGLEAMSNGIQFVKDEDAGIVRWGKKRLPRWKKLWEFYSGKSGIGRLVQTSFLFYGGITTAFLAYFAVLARRFQLFTSILGWLGLSLIFAGTAGNLIDRLNPNVNGITDFVYLALACFQRGRFVYYYRCHLAGIFTRLHQERSRTYAK
jgi:hypothetical protein